MLVGRLLLLLVVRLLRFIPHVLLVVALTLSPVAVWAVAEIERQVLNNYFVIRCWQRRLEGPLLLAPRRRRWSALYFGDGASRRLARR